MPFFNQALVFIIIAMLSIQYGASVAKQMIPLAGPAGTTALRVLVAALVLIITVRPWRASFTPEKWRATALYGSSLGFMNLLFYFALARIPLGVAVALEFTGPLAIALLSSRKLADLLWVFLAGLGVYLILPGAQDIVVVDTLGVFMALGAGFFWGLYIHFGKLASAGGSSASVSAVGMGFAACVTLPVGLFLNFDQVVDISVWPMAIMIGILSSALPYFLEMKAMKAMPAKTFGVLMSLEPVVASVMGIIFLHENLTETQWLAVSSIIVASAGASLSAK